MQKLLATIALAILTGMVARAAQVGDTVFGFVGVENRVPLAVSNDPQEVMHIVLDSGVWLVSGQMNFLSLNTPAGTMFTAGNISVGSLSLDPDSDRTGYGGTSGSSWQHNQKHFSGSPFSRRARWHEHNYGRWLV